MLRHKCATLLFAAALMILPYARIQARTQTTARARTQSGHRQRGTKQQQIPANGWVKWTGPDGDFTIMLPTAPTPEDPATNPQGLVSAIRAYDAATDATFFQVNIQDYGGEPDSPAANSFGSSTYEEVLVRGLRGDGVLVISARRLAPNVSELEYWSPARRNPGHRLHQIARDIIYRGRNYHLSCGNRFEDREGDRQICRNFFNSFHLTREAKRIE